MAERSGDRDPCSTVAVTVESDVHHVAAEIRSVPVASIFRVKKCCFILSRFALFLAGHLSHHAVSAICPQAQRSIPDELPTVPCLALFFPRTPPVAFTPFPPPFRCIGVPRLDHTTADTYEYMMAGTYEHRHGRWTAELFNELRLTRRRRSSRTALPPQSEREESAGQGGLSLPLPPLRGIVGSLFRHCVMFHPQFSKGSSSS